MSCILILYDGMNASEEGTGLNRRRRRGDIYYVSEEGTGLNRRRRRGDYMYCIGGRDRVEPEA